MKAFLLVKIPARICVFICALLCVASSDSFGQAEPNNPVTYDTTITEKANGEGPISWTVRITRQKSDKSLRPAIFFIPGSGEVGTGGAALTSYGPHYWLLNGWDGGVKLGNGTHYPVIVSIQQPAQNMRPWHLKAVLEALLTALPINRTSVHVTGLSQGSYEWGELIGFSASPGDHSSMSEIKSWVNLEGVGPGDNFLGYDQAYPAVYGTWAKTYGGRFFGLEGTQDSRNIWQISQAMNAAVPNSAYFSYENIGGGAHCCWNSMYDPSVTNWRNIAPITNPNVVASTNPASTIGNYYVAPTGTNIFQWMLRQGDTSMTSSSSAPAPTPPVVSAGNNATIVMPTSSTTLSGQVTAAAGTTIASNSWTKTSGSTASITSPSSMTTAVTGLTTGTYVFTLTSKNNAGQASSAAVTVTVQAQTSTGTQAPTVTFANPSPSVTLPVSTVTLQGTATVFGGATLSSVRWHTISAPVVPGVVSPNSATTSVVGLIAGTYVMQLTATDSRGKTGSAQLTLKVNPAVSQPPTVTFANPSPSVTLPVSTVTLQGTPAVFGGATLSSVRWRTISAPVVPGVVSPNSATTSVVGLIAGTYVMQLTATDSRGNTGSAQLTLKVNPATSQPVQTVPPPVVPTSTLKTFVAPGEYQVFFIDQSKHLYAVGTNIRTLGVSEIGTPGTTLPVALPSNLTVQTAAAGLHGGAAVDNNGNVWAWGDNDQGEAGNGTTSTTQVMTPVQITTDINGNTFTGVKALSAYWSQNASSGWYGIKNDGSLWVWGQTLGGIQGDGTTGNTALTRPKQVPVPGGRKVAQVSAGNIAIVLCTDGTVWTCGGGPNTNPQDLGYAVSGNSYLSLQQLTGLSGIVQVAGGGSFNYALKSDGTLFGWGYYGYYLGGTGGTNTPIPTPVNLATRLNLPHPVKMIVTDMVCTHVILTDGTLWGWGDNAQGGIGNGKELNYATTATPYTWDYNAADLLQQSPVQITTRNDFVAVFATQPFVMYTYAETADGQLYSWGRNKGGVLGNGVVGCSSVAASYPNSWDVPLATMVYPLAITTARVVPSPYCIAHPTTSPCNQCAVTTQIATSAGMEKSAATSSALAPTSLNSGGLTAEQILVYPTLTTGMLNLRISSDTNGTVQATIFDVNGKMVQEERMNKQSTYLEQSLNVGRLPQGMYVIQVLIGNQKRMVTKFVKQ